MIQILPLIALLSAPALAPENWVSVGTDDASHATLWIDTDSIREEGGLRYFRIKMIAVDATGIADLVADCKAGVLEARRTELTRTGAAPVVTEFAPGENHKPPDDEISAAMLKRACA